MRAGGRFGPPAGYCPKRLSSTQRAVPVRLHMLARCARTGVRSHLLVFAGVQILVPPVSGMDSQFVDGPLPQAAMDRLFDIGIVDASGDGRTDVYPTNHRFRESLLIAAANDEYQDVVAPNGLDQSKDFPWADLSFTGPAVEKPGLYVFWLGTELLMQAHEIPVPESWRRTIRMDDRVQAMESERLSAKHAGKGTLEGETEIQFMANHTELLRLRPLGQGLLITYEFADTVRPEQIFLASGMISPKSRTLANRQEIREKLFLSEGARQLVDVAAHLDAEKRSCYGRHARRVDLDRYGRLDLFVNGYEQGNVDNRYPRQLRRQDDGGRLRDVADDVGLGLRNHRVGGFAWYDVEGDVDLVAIQHEGLFLYRTVEGRYMQEVILARIANDAEKAGGTTADEWEYDCQLAIADYGSNGDHNVFLASKPGNVLLRNDEGRVIVVDSVLIRLRAASVTANWVAFDHDDLVHLYLVLQGLVRQNPSSRYERTGPLELSPEQFDAAIINWFDCNNDGRVITLLALHEVSGYKHGWAFARTPRPPSVWDRRGVRDTDPACIWLQLSVEGPPRDRQGVGARITAVTAEGIKAQEVATTYGAYFSQGRYGVYYGLSGTRRVDRVIVRGPEGRTRTLKDLEIHRLVVVAVDSNP